jgi:hypothetical protein
MHRAREYQRNFCFLVALAYLGLATAGNAVAADTFDGTYTGPRRVIRDDNSAGCSLAPNPHMVLTVKNDHFVIAWGIVLPVDVDADGTFDKSVIWSAHGVERIDGKITGDKLEADLGDARCVVHLSLQKSSSEEDSIWFSVHPDLCTQMGGEPAGIDTQRNMPLCKISREACPSVPGYQVVTRPSQVRANTIVTVCEKDLSGLANELLFPVARGDRQGCDKGRGHMQDMGEADYCLISMSDCVSRGGHPEVGKAGPAGRRICRGLKD